MKIQDDEKLNMKIRTSKQKIPLINNIINKISINTKFVFSFLLLIIFHFLIFISLNNKKKNIKINLPKKPIDNEQKEKKFFSKLKLILNNYEISENEMMKKHTTFELGGPAKFFIKPKSINKIIKVIRLCKEYNIEYFILGNGSNLLVSENGFDGLVINIHEDNFSDLKIEKIDKSNYKVSVGGGILMKTLAKRLCLLSLSGLEDIIDIPGTIGGGIIMNAQAYGKGIIYHSLDKVKVITPEGEIKELSKIDCQLRHRGSFLRDNKYLVIEATFNLIKIDKMIIQKTMADLTSRRYANQPMYFPNAGSFFIWDKNKFGSLYEKYKENNLVGYSVGDAMIYKNNIAFIVNFGNAKSSDVYEIVIHVEKIMKFKYNINIKREVIILGSFS